MNTLPAATPSWVDLGTPDVKGALAFYHRLFGWEAEGLDDGREHDWFLQRLEGKAITGIGGIQPAQPRGWTAFILSADAAATAAATAAAGGAVLTEPIQAWEYGTTALLADSGGAHFAIWQPDEDKLVADLYRTPGAFCWHELYTPDVAAAGAFYKKVFGWGTDAPPDESGVAHWTLDGQRVARATAAAGLPGSENPGWLAYFSVADCDAATALLTELGGAVLAAPQETADGRVAVVRDVDEAVFAIVQLR